MRRHPTIICGGMGIYVSQEKIVREVSRHKKGLGVVSGTGIHIIVPRILQNGDPEGHYRRALAAFPDQAMATRILKRFYVHNGISPTTPFKHIEHLSLTPSPELIELVIVSNFCQIWLAKEGHKNKVGVNYLEKLQMPLMYAIYGALLAKVDYLFVGAGIPTQISGILDKLLKHNPATYEIYVIGAENSDEFLMHFNPREYMRCPLPKLKRPYFFPIISSVVIALAMTRSGDQILDGFVEESKEAGGHSANPRGKAIFTKDGQPIYGKRDEFNYQQLRDIGLPFYCAGACASPEALTHARLLGAIGIQVGTIFSLCNLSGIDKGVRDYIRKEAYNRRLIVFNDPRISPTGFTFKVARIPGTIGDSVVYKSRIRICDLGGLIQPYLRKNGTVGYRCPAEPEKAYILKGGQIEDTVGRGCLCNGLSSTVKLGQRLPQGLIEPSIVTQGQNLDFLQYLMCDEDDDYSVEDVFNHLLRRCSF